MPTDISKLKVAIVHDWLVTARGGERVLDALCELFPQAELFTLFCRKGQNTSRVESHTIHTSFLNRFPRVERYYRYLLPLMPLAVEKLPLQGFDLVISSSHCVAKGVIPDPTALHVSYCYTPLRYAWDQSHHYFSGLKAALVSPVLHYLRMWDVSAAARVDRFVAISDFVGKRIEKYYRRSSDVVFPFVDLQRFKRVHGERGDYYLMVTAFAPYKRVELAIQACERLGRRLVIVGGGQEADRLRKLGGAHTEFLGNLPDDQIPDLYAGARALLFPGVEDFGITPLESMASGTPVIAYGAGGALETIEDGKTGIFFHEPTAESLAQAILKFENLNFPWAENCRERAQFFSRSRFQNEFMGIVGALLDKQRPLTMGKREALPDFYLGA
jgi:glycosyltransferase involved in cell wall biosynthesis